MRDRANQVLRSRSFWALADQGVASGANYVTIILITRVLAEQQFGQFSLLWELMLFLNGVHAALVVYPLTVRGAKLGVDAMRPICTIGLILTLALAPVSGGAMFVQGAFLNWTIGVMAALAIGAFQLHETLRRGLMSQFRYTELIWGDAVGYLGQLAAVSVLALMGALTVPAVYASMTITFLLAALVQATRVRIKLPAHDDIRGISAEFWVLGRWMLATSLTTFFTGYGVQLCLNWAQDLTHVAKFQAMANLTRLANPVLAAMTGLIVPAVAASGNARAGVKYALLGATLLAPYFALLLVAPGFGVALIYGRDSEYLGFPREVRATIAGAALLFATAMLTAVLGGLGRSKAFFYTQLVNTVATILLVFPAAIVYGWRAAIMGVLGTTLITLVTTIILLWKNPRPTSMPAASPD